MEPAEAFGRALRSRRLEAEMTQEKLALDAGLARVYISWIENGKKQPTFGTMLKLACALGCSAKELVDEAETLLLKHTDVC
jgi:transcriptional regulator with XRE-family HTH domain